MDTGGRYHEISLLKLRMSLVELIPHWQCVREREDFRSFQNFGSLVVICKSDRQLSDFNSKFP